MYDRLIIKRVLLLITAVILPVLTCSAVVKGNEVVIIVLESILK